ncbi:uncharacterized protein K452DRAFT_239992 [Aplosporella prunicola CBS 121167]|uniref:Uncharacterized protein n=1 Tax=Aplosporella prunicola CBS 121167 TaxID=1176127 RepID=A0A6A6AVW5_9PEZI|nr:uncharacterized protein K452DRAFT_239992 [Aplosporella prunicola CBS 121167]KAF2135094.1 hypothetical protein K452DRAFT_239992 [Aplosporella prunicola CBS 121167]
MEDEIDQFFSQYPTFDYNRNRSPPLEFRRLCRFFGWSRNIEGDYPPEQKAAWADFRVATVLAFNSAFGHDDQDREAWGRICALLGINPIPRKLRDRRKAVTKTHVNLVDLLDRHRIGGSIRIFETEFELKEYTIQKGKYFPKEEAYEGGLLKWLLREIHGQYHGGRGKGKNHQRRQRS